MPSQTEQRKTEMKGVSCLRLHKDREKHGWEFRLQAQSQSQGQGQDHGSLQRPQTHTDPCELSLDLSLPIKLWAPSLTSQAQGWKHSLLTYYLPMPAVLCGLNS